MFPKDLCSGCICHVSNMSFSIYLPKLSHWNWLLCVLDLWAAQTQSLIFEWCEACWKAIMGLFAWLHVHNPRWGLTSKSSASNIVRHLLLDTLLFKGLPAFCFSHLAVATWGFSTNCFWVKTNIQYSQWFPLIWSAHLPALYVNHFARYSLIEYLASSHVSTWDNTIVAGWGCTKGYCAGRGARGLSTIIWLPGSSCWSTADASKDGTYCGRNGPDPPVC